MKIQGSQYVTLWKMCLQFMNGMEEMFVPVRIISSCLESSSKFSLKPRINSKMEKNSFLGDFPLCFSFLYEQHG